MNAPTDQTGPPRQGCRFATALVLAAAGAAGAFAAIRLVLALPAIPYNIGELFPTRYRGVYLAAFSVLLVWIGTGPVWAADLLARRRRQVPLIGFWAAVIGLITWVILRFAVTRESLGDVLGAPTLRWPGDWEWLCRFLALQGLFTLPLLAAGVAVAGAARLPRRAAAWLAAKALLWSMPWLTLCWVVVVTWANTDNLTELIRRTPFGWIGPAGLTAANFLVALNAAALADAWVRRGARARLLTGAMTVLLTAPVWALVWLGLNPAVNKYGLTFPAATFLLGPDRKAQLSVLELFGRWSVVQIGMVLALGWGGAVALLLRPRWPRRGAAGGSADRETLVAPAAPAHPGRAYLILTLLYAAFLVYGCLVPFEFLPITFRQAWEVFSDSRLLMQARWGQSDVVTNIAMAVPLCFFALGAWSREAARGGLWYKVPVLFALACAFGVALEFGQVFVRQRVSSIHDIIAQAIGCVIGLAAWLAFGGPLTAWVRRLLAERRSRQLCEKLLLIYTAALILYQLLPLTPTISATQILRKYRRGMINLVPFADPMAVGLDALLMKSALYLPIGYLLALRGAGRGRAMLWALAGGVLFAAGLETLQVCIRSRLATSTDVLLGTFGAAVGGALACLFGPCARGQGVHSRWWRSGGGWVKLAVLAVWLLAMAGRRWGGFRLDWPADGIGQRVGGILAVPLFDMVRRLGPLEAVARLGRELASLLVVGMLLQSLLAGRGGRRRIAAAAVTVLIALTLEFGALVFVAYRPDLTIALAGLTAGIAGAWAYPGFVRVFLKHPGGNGENDK